MDPVQGNKIKVGRKILINELGKKITILDNLEDGSVDFLRAQHIYRLVHSLKGSAPVFGLIRIGHIADQLVKKWEWVNREDINLSEELIPSAIASSLTLVHELIEEYEISKKMIEVDRDEPVSTIQVSAHPGSRILIVDDDEALRSYLVKSLQSDGYIADGVHNIDNAKAKLYQNKYDLITLDLRMHPQSGYDLFYFLKEDPTLKWLPLIVLSGENDLQDKVRCLQLGADDYVTKPFQYEELAARIFSLLRRTMIFSQMAFRDPLTGIFNRRYFDNQMQLELKRIERFPAPISLAFIDIDRFKNINDTYGHSIGDLVLQAMAHTLQEYVRSTDLVARFGGEEFVIIFPNTTGQQAAALIQAVLDKIRRSPITEHEGQAYNITFSAGIAQWQPGVDVQKWIQVADETMYKAKEQGRNRCLLYDYSLEEVSTSAIRKRILIVDDDRMIRAILMSKLAHLPVDLMEATDGEEGLQILITEVVDLCLLDAIMPKMDGFGLLLALRDNKKALNEEMKVIMLSGRINDEDIARGLMLGADDYISKPFSMIELEAKVKKILQLE
ncbi:diguanylate cyclase [Paenibacillus psychroresistens]|uniref:Diguanylate cyclase n=1 Tax=Paenibacillus psychroresistens TaxID=1778678 RepID=A0A6B8RM81_9BACL|nr:diguanylate cyclase [Paenibacillus psychroresistens]QGQ97129.1 diguanylate cyclase [Paenibacillus psychroresistens]